DNVLVVCFGGGSTFRTSLLMGAKVDVVELVSDVIRRAPFFQHDASKNLSRPGVGVFIEDGRNYLLRTEKTYDVIVVDGTPPLYSAGTVNLYTAQFMTLARAHLKPGGV